MKPLRIGVVGAGLGGLSAAIRLAASGHEVELFEANDAPGGKAGSLRLGDYRFDTGPSLVTMPDVFRQLFAQAGASMDEFLVLNPLEEICRYEFADGVTLFSHSEGQRLASDMADRLEDSSESIRRYLNVSRRIYRSTSALFLERSLHEWSTYFHRDAFRALLAIGRIGAFRSMDSMSRRFFSDPRTIQFFNRYATYNGSSPYKAPGTLSVISHVEYGLGAWYAPSGVHAIPKAMMRLAEEVGVTVALGTEVDSISYDRARTITGLTVDRELVPFDVVVSNSDVAATYRTLLRDEAAPFLRRHERLEPSSSALLFFFGMNRSYPGLALHNIFFGKDYSEEFSKIFDARSVSDDPTIYLNITSKVNSDDAPPGCENWFVLVNAPYDDGQAWSSITSAVRHVVVARLSTSLGVDIERDIAVEEVVTPVDLELATGSRFGSFYGVSSNSRVAAFLRHPNRSRRYRGLYFCGGSVHPGGGMPLAVLSGKIVADIVDKRFARGKK